MIRLNPVGPDPASLAEREAEMRRALAATRAAQRFRERRPWWRRRVATLFQRCLAVHLLNATTPPSALR
jgi:hypothetical protein